MIASQTNVPEENCHLLENCPPAFLFTFFEKVLAVCEFFTGTVFRCKILRHFPFFFLWSFIHSIGIIFFAGRKCVVFVIISKERREANFCDISTKSEILYLHKTFNIGSTTKVNCREFYDVFILHSICT